MIRELSSFEKAIVLIKNTDKKDKKIFDLNTRDKEKINCSKIKDEEFFGVAKVKYNYEIIIDDENKSLYNLEKIKFLI